MITKLNEYLSKSEKETEQIAIDFSDRLQNGDIVVLSGPLGSGKTFFVKKIAEHFKIQNTTSPTFAIVNEYLDEKRIYHFDFYRINSINELHDIGVEDYLSDSEAISFIEWGELFKEILPHSRYEVQFILNEDDSRRIIIKKYE